MAYDFDVAGLMRDVVAPKVENSIFEKPFEQLTSVFTEDTVNEGGKKIIRQIEVAKTSNADTYTKGDSDPDAGTITAVDAEWNLVYQHTAAEVYNIDIFQAQKGGVKGIEDLLTYAIQKESGPLWEMIYDDCMTQIKADLTATGTYSDAALSRVTYPTLAPYNELTDTANTYTLMRDLAYNTLLNKSTMRGEYIYVCEPNTYHTLVTQSADDFSWNVPADGDVGKSIGFGRWTNLDGFRLFVVDGMTTGDVLFVNPNDVYIKKHRPLSITAVPSGRDSIKFVIRVGVNAFVENVGKQGMMTNKDS